MSEIRKTVLQTLKDMSKGKKVVLSSTDIAELLEIEEKIVAPMLCNLLLTHSSIHRKEEERTQNGKTTRYVYWYDPKTVNPYFGKTRISNRERKNREKI